MLVTLPFIALTSLKQKTSRSPWTLLKEYWLQSTCMLKQQRRCRSECRRDLRSRLRAEIIKSNGSSWAKAKGYGA